jgi:hypothetical protein
MGLCSGNVQIIRGVIAHEIVHRRSLFWKVVTTLSITRSYNSYFTIHHIELHHINVGTAKDAESAALGVPWNTYMYEMEVATRIGTWKAEVARLKKKGH